ncbi:uncharacterized protein LOC6558567 [Drosophila grimshawi]|uniref:GH17098 n=1 Tax=Drosophila grimshawi TaxID=7222 RepID=B4J062_DROGR|nr:uncharacterized protein LOC6558567 [Drosophila grimshawi]EDV97855.1 GH17098 [Drosophila grimshawi]
MIALLIFAFLTLSQAVELEKPEQKVSEPVELPLHVVNLINNHINQVLEQKKPGQTTTLTGHVPQVAAANGKGNANENGGKAAVPHLDLLPPHVGQPVVTQVINHQATATLQQAAPAAGHNKVLPQVVVSVPGKAPVDISDKVNKIHQQVVHVMHQAQTQIPLVINQAIKEREKQQQNQQKPKPRSSLTSSTTATGKPDHKTARLLSSNEPVPVLVEGQRELQQLGKCNFQCPQQALPVCATNGNCIVEFAGQCELSEWNCFNTKNVFRQVQDDECKNTVKCYDRDMM